MPMTSSHAPIRQSQSAASAERQTMRRGERVITTDILARGLGFSIDDCGLAGCGETMEAPPVTQRNWRGFDQTRPTPSLDGESVLLVKTGGGGKFRWPGR